MTATMSDVIAQNTPGSSEGYPVGVPTSYSWYGGGGHTTASSPPPSNFSAVTGWGQIYPEVGAAPYSNSSDTVQIANAQTWVHLTTGQWVLVQNQATDQIAGAHFLADFSGNSNIAWQETVQPDGSVTVDPPATGYNDHFWPNARGTYTPGTVDGVYVQMDMRTNDPNLKLVANVGADWWLDSTASYVSGFNNNPGAGMSDWVELSTTWQTLAFYSLTASQLQADPPPPLVGSTVSSGGTGGTVSSGGTGGTVVSSGVTDVVSSGETSSGVLILAGGTQIDQGLVVNPTVNGLELVSSGGVASSAHVNSGGALYVSNGGVASGAVVSSGGLEVIFSGGHANGTVVNSGGRDIVSAGGVDAGAQLNGGSEFVSSGGVASGTVVHNGGALYVSNGGVASGAVVSTGGLEVISSGGRAIGTIVSSGGREIVSSGGIDGGGGVITRHGHSQGGSAVATTITSGGSAYIAAGGFMGAATISGGTVEVASGATTRGATFTFASGGGGMLQLDDSVHFGGSVAGFAQPDLLDLRDVAFTSATTLSWTQLTSGTSASGTLTVSGGASVANVTLLGQYVAGQFTLASDGHNGTIVGDPPAVAQTDHGSGMIVNPHHA